MSSYIVDHPQPLTMFTFELADLTTAYLKEIDAKCPSALVKSGRRRYPSFSSSSLNVSLVDYQSLEKACFIGSGGHHIPAINPGRELYLKHGLACAVRIFALDLDAVDYICSLFIGLDTTNHVDTQIQYPGLVLSTEQNSYGPTALSLRSF